MKSKLLGIIFSGLMILNILTPIIANAATVDSHEKNNSQERHSNDEQPTVSELQSMDRFVVVENNQFVFNLPDKIEIDTDLYEAVTASINEINR